MNENFKILPSIVYLNPIENLQIVRAEITSELNLTIDIINLGDSIVEGVTFGIKFKNLNDEYLSKDELIYHFTIESFPKKIYFVSPFSIEDIFKDTRKVEIRIIELNTKNRTVKYNIDTEKKHELPLITEDKHQKMIKFLGENILTYGKNLIDGWRCVCMTTNTKEQETCRLCSRNKNFILNNLTEPLINAKILNAISSENLIDNKTMNILEKNLTKTNITKSASSINALNIKRINKNKFKKNEKKFRKKFLFLILFIIISITLFFPLKNKYENFIVNNKISNGEKLISKGEYKKALAVFSSIKRNQINENKHYIERIENKINLTKILINSKINFQEGVKYLNRKNYIEALKYFKKVSENDNKNYTTSQKNITKIEDLILTKIIKYFLSNKKDKALNLLNNYLKIIPESAKGLTLRKDILNNNKSKIKNFYIDNFNMTENRAKLSKKSKEILNTYQEISDNSILYSLPDNKSKKVIQIKNNIDAYIKDVKIDGNDKLWCYVEIQNDKKNVLGWISSNELINKDKG